MKCPVCKKLFWTHAIRQHIRVAAINEVYRNYVEGKKKPHQDFIENNYEWVKIRRIKIHGK
jgi:hypothetical protein